MAITKVLADTSMSLICPTDVDGKIKNVKKSFGGVKASATPDKINTVALAISAVLANPAESIYANESHLIVDDEA